MSACFPLTDHQDTSIARTARRLSGSWAARLSRHFTELDRRRRLARLLGYDDRMLDDMGLIRYDIEEALRLPLSVNAIEALHGK